MAKISRKQLRSLNIGIETIVYIGVALALGFIVPWVDQRFIPGWFSPVDKSTMTSMLSAVASGMITLTGVVFSLVFVLLQFGSATYSPRLAPIFAHSYALRHSLGIFTGTFLFSLSAMRTIGMGETDQVSSLPVWISFIWLLASISILARLIRVFATLTISNVLTALGRTGQKSIKKIYNPYYSSSKPNTAGDHSSVEREGNVIRKILYEGGPGYLTGYKLKSLLALATTTHTTIFLPYFIGDALKNGTAIALIQGNNTDIKESCIYRLIQTGIERSFTYDPKYSFRLLVDTAIRALSPGINDPTTAVQVLDHIESLLQHLGNSDLDIGEVRDQGGVLRLVFRTPTWEDYLQLGLSEIMHYGAGSIQVERRLESLLLFLKEAVPPERTEAVVRLMEQRRSLSYSSFANETFREWANIPDREGIGSSDSVPALLKAAGYSSE